MAKAKTQLKDAVDKAVSKAAGARPVSCHGRNERRAFSRVHRATEGWADSKRHRGAGLGHPGPKHHLGGIVFWFRRAWQIWGRREKEIGSSPLASSDDMFYDASIK